MSVEECLALSFRDLNLPGLACLVSFNGEVSDYYFGKSDLQNNSPINATSVFNIASVGTLIANSNKHFDADKIIDEVYKLMQN